MNFVIADVQGTKDYVVPFSPLDRISLWLGGKYATTVDMSNSSVENADVLIPQHDEEEATACKTM